LSSSHPAAKRSTEQQVVGSEKHYVLRGNRSTTQSAQSTKATRQVDKNKAVNDMVQIVAAEEVHKKNSPKLVDELARKRKVQSIHDVAEDFKRLKGGIQPHVA
jgi:hypothetical protein